MLRTVFLLLLFVPFFISAQEEKEIMYRIYDDAMDECGYVNANGDTLIPFGECLVCFSDSLNYAIVIKWGDRSYGFPAIDASGKEVFRVFVYDNGPDYIEDGTFRIVKDGLIGYATSSGEIIIPPTYEAAWPFKDGRARVSFKATKVQEGEHWFWLEEEPFYIDKEDNRHENQTNK